MQDGRFNIFWFLSLLAPAVLMLGAAAFRRRWVLFVAAAISLLTTYALCNLAVQKKWDTRLASAVTEAELARATADGANLVFTAYFIAPMEAILYTTFWGVIGRRYFRRAITAPNQRLERP